MQELHFVHMQNQCCFQYKKAPATAVGVTACAAAAIVSLSVLLLSLPGLSEDSSLQLPLGLEAPVMAPNFPCSLSFLAVSAADAAEAHMLHDMMVFITATVDVIITFTATVNCT